MEEGIISSQLYWPPLPFVSSSNLFNLPLFPSLSSQKRIFAFEQQPVGFTWRSIAHQEKLDSERAQVFIYLKSLGFGWLEEGESCVRARSLVRSIARKQSRMAANSMRRQNWREIRLALLAWLVRYDDKSDERVGLPYLCKHSGEPNPAIFIVVYGHPLDSTRLDSHLVLAFVPLLGESSSRGSDMV